MKLLLKELTRWRAKAEMLEIQLKSSIKEIQRLNRKLDDLRPTGLYINHKSKEIKLKADIPVLQLPLIARCNAIENKPGSYRVLARIEHPVKIQYAMYANYPEALKKHELIELLKETTERTIKAFYYYLFPKGDWEDL